MTPSTPTAREIALRIGGSVGGCHKVLKNLHEMGLLDRKKSGRNLYYIVRDRNPAVKHFKIFINLQELHGLVKRIEHECKKIILFGSCSTGEDILDSDIDLMIVTENVKNVKRTLKNKSINGRQLKPIILAPRELVRMRKDDPAFFDEVNKGITLWREHNE